MNTTFPNNTFLNNTSRPQKESPDLEFYMRIRFNYGVYGGVLSFFIIVVNIVVLIAILSNPKLRIRLRYLMIVSLAVADLINGMTSCPVRAGVILEDRLTHGCATYLFVVVFEDYVQTFVGTWNIVGLNAEYLCKLLKVRLPTVSNRQQKVAIAVCIALPWLTMCCVIFPIAYTHSGTFYRVSSLFCYVRIEKYARTIVIYLSFFIPAILSVVQIIALITFYVCGRRTGSLMTSEKTPLWMFVVASTVTIVMVLAEQVFSLNLETLKLNLKMFALLYFGTVACSDSKSAVLPFVWFMCPDIRASCVELYNKLPWRSSLDVHKTNEPVNFRNLEEEK